MLWTYINKELLQEDWMMGQFIFGMHTKQFKVIKVRLDTSIKSMKLR